MARRLVATTLLAAGMAIAGNLAGCRTVDPSPFNPGTMRAAESAGVTQQPALVLPALPTTLDAPYLGPTRSATQPAPADTDPRTRATVREATLRELIHLAVANSHDVRVAGYQPAIEETRVTEAQARFDPVFFLRPGYERRDSGTAGTLIYNPLTGTNTTADFDRADIASIATGIKQNLITGGSVELRYQVSRNDLSPQRYTLNPYYDSELTLEITQPLLRDFGPEVNQARINVARNTQRVAVLEFRNELEKNLSDVEQVYWQLRAAQRDVAIAEELLEKTRETAFIIRGRHDVTRVQRSQADAAVDSRYAVLVRAKGRLRELSNNLKRLINDPTMPVSSPVLLLAKDPGVEAPIQFDPREQVLAGQAYRLELAQQAIRIDSADIVRRVAKNGLLPRLDLKAAVGVQGLDDSFGDALGNQFSFDHIPWSVGIELEVPIGNREAQAVYQRSLLQRQQAIDQYQALLSQVALDVLNAVNSVESSWNELVATRRARFMQADALLAIQQREDTGEPLTPTFVQLKLDSQARLADVSQQENQSITNYNIALMQLERAKGLLLKYNNVEIEEFKKPYVSTLQGR